MPRYDDQWLVEVMGWDQERGDGGLINFDRRHLAWNFVFSAGIQGSHMFVVSFLETGRRWPKLFVCFNLLNTLLSSNLHPDSITM